jgi:membrane protease YdiL (CAAX protease family)
MMAVNRILLAADASRELIGAPQILYALMLTAGAALLLVWTIRFAAAGARNPLRHAPVRRHRLPLWFAPVQIVLWLAIAAIVTLAAPKLPFGRSEEAKEAFSYFFVGIWHFLLFVFLLVVAYFGFVRGFKGLGLRLRTLPADIGAGFLTLLAALPLIEISLIITRILGQFLNFQLETHPTLLSLEQYDQWWMQALLIFFAVITAPLIEELLFRGFLQSSLTGSLENPWGSILITSAIFAALHPPTHWLALFVLSVFLGYSYEKSGSLLRPVFIHIFFNSTSILLTLWTVKAAG